MKYKIISGRYEAGNEEQQMGHCIVEKYGLKLSPVQEEMYVNELAVAYYRYVGEADRLDGLRAMLVTVLDHMPSPVPDGETFTSFFESIWGTELLMNVMTYGYFQLNSVLEAMKTDREFAEVISELGVTISVNDVKECKEEITSDNAEKFLDVAMENIKACGIEVPKISLELVDNPMIQCAQSV